MAEVVVHENENFESLLKRFNKKVVQKGILTEVKRRERFEKPSAKHKKKEATKRRKSANSQEHGATCQPLVRLAGD